LLNYLRQWRAYRELARDRVYPPVAVRFTPCLGEAASSQDVGYYFYQDSWAARQVFREKPAFAVDVGSTVLLEGIISQFCRLIAVDIRPLRAKMCGLDTRAGTITALPFQDGEVPCLTSMCVIEHIGLGRYGDPIDPHGTQKAVQEIARVIQPGGLVVFSVPVGKSSLIEFNAHRRFTLAEVDDFFPGWTKADSCVLVPEPVPITMAAIEACGFPVICMAVRKPGGSSDGRKAIAING